VVLGELKKEIKGLLSQKRWEHTLRVVSASFELISCLQIEIEANKVETAALLHDCAKDLPLGEQLKKAGYFGIVLTSSDLLCPKTLHGRVGAGIVQHEFGIVDADIIQAVALHTTGGPRMSPLAKIIFVADYIEPGRSFPGVEKLRLLAKKELNGAVLACMEQTLLYLLQRGDFIHPRMIAARNYILAAEDYTLV
jgi:predicted HD superfamily hydrolase involved in NAD metabolism